MTNSQNILSKHFMLCVLAVRSATHQIYLLPRPTNIPPRNISDGVILVVRLVDCLMVVRIVSGGRLLGGCRFQLLREFENSMTLLVPTTVPLY